MNKDKLDKILYLHQKWIAGDPEGVRADLRGVALRGANFIGADLRGVDLRGANLIGADLRDVDLRDAILKDTVLTRSILTDARLPHFQICPEEGSFIAYKKAGGAVLKLKIPEASKRTSTLDGRKCRAESAYTLGVLADTNRTEFYTRNNAVYKVGQITHADSFDDDIRVECTHGIHFFMTKKEAQEW